VSRVAAAFLLFAALAPGVASAADGERRPEGVSLLGVDLVAPEPPAAFRESQEGLLAEAKARRERDPADPEAWIWVGRRQAYLGLYRAAITTYSEALERFPEEARLYRHRGHRHLTLRELDLAIRDLERGVALVEGTPDRVEPDGLPNERGIPTSTLQSNLWYHLGLAHYVAGDLDAALEAYRRCLRVSTNPDMSVATRHWLYMTLRRLERPDEAAAVLEPVDADLDVIENDGYHRLLLAYKGDLDPDELLAESVVEGDAIGYPTVAYGVGNWHLYNGRPTRAFEIFDSILEGSAWAAFGTLAAEAEVARRVGDP
jgi:tetratricopeptide (TPR) repeat protein